MKPLSPSSRSASGFTLVEILVSLAVLSLMMLGVAQILNGTLITSLGAYKHMDADTQARLVLDRMAYDIAHIVKRTDVDYVFQKNSLAGSLNGNDQMAFYSESGGYYPSGVSASPGGGGEVSLVGYMIPNNAATPALNNQLCRLSKGIAWNGYKSNLPAMVFNPLAALATGTNTVSTNGTYSNTLLTTKWDGASSNGVADGSDVDYQVIGDQVFRMEFTFLVQTSASGAYATGTGTPLGYTSGGFYDYPWSPTGNNSVRGLQDVTAIVVSIAVLDSKSRAMLGSTATASTILNTAAANLQKDTCTSATPINYTAATANTTGYLPLSLWKTNLLNTTGTPHLGLPKEVWQQVRFYQRFCYLNHLQ